MSKTTASICQRAWAQLYLACQSIQTKWTLALSPTTLQRKTLTFSTFVDATWCICTSNTRVSLDTLARDVVVTRSMSVAVVWTQLLVTILTRPANVAFAESILAITLSVDTSFLFARLVFASLAGKTNITLAC